MAVLALLEDTANARFFMDCADDLAHDDDIIRQGECGVPLLLQSSSERAAFTTLVTL